MWGFFILITVYIEAYGTLFTPNFHIPIVGRWDALGFLQDFIALGVFAGITKTGFELYGAALRGQGESTYLHTSFGSVANRSSYLLNLSGPSLQLDTMCSASL